MTLTDVFCTGHHAAVTANVRPGTTVAVVGDGAVGLCAVLAAKRLGAEQVILMGRHTDRTTLGVDFGATDVVLATGEEDGPIGMDMITRNITLTGGVDPARHYIDDVLADVLEGRIEPGRVFDRTVDLAGVPDGYRAMADRQALKVLVTP